MRVSKINFLILTGSVMQTVSSVAGEIPQVPAAVVIDARNSVYKTKENSSGSDLNYSENFINVTAGKNIVIPVASGFTNRFVTPFSDPVVISTSLSMTDGQGSGEIFIRGNIVYVSTNREYPVTMFITQKDNESAAISLTLVPKKIPPREITFSLAGYAPEKFRSRHDLKNESETGSDPDYLTELKNLLKTIALNEVPDGYSLQNIISGTYHPDCQSPGFRVSFADGQLLTGRIHDVYIGRVANISGAAATADEKMCAGREVAAVALWPKILLKSGESTEIYVVTSKSGYGKRGNFRPNLLRVK